MAPDLPEGTQTDVGLRSLFGIYNEDSSPDLPEEST